MKNERTNTVGNRYENLPPDEFLRYLGYVLLFAAAVEFCAQFAFVSSSKENLVEFVLRESFMVAGFAAVGFFFVLLFNYYMDIYVGVEPNEKLVRRVSLITFVICLIKGLVAIYSLACNMEQPFLYVAFYAGDVLAWVLCCVFFLMVYVFVFSRRGRLPKVKALRVLSPIFALIFIMNGVVALCVVMMNRGFANLAYYLTDAVAWIAVAIGLFRICRDDLFSRVYVETDDEDDELYETMEAAFERAARGVSDDK